MSNLTYEEKLHIAKIAYKAIKNVIDGVESYADCRVSACCDECIQIDDELFTERQLRE